MYDGSTYHNVQQQSERFIARYDCYIISDHCQQSGSQVRFHTKVCLHSQ